MIGQEVEKVFPEWISKSSDGYRIFSPEGFEALTVEALRELKQENNQLRQEVHALEQALAVKKRR